MAGAAGFEPTHARIKTWCLTAWRRPKKSTSLISHPAWQDYSDFVLALRASLVNSAVRLAARVRRTYACQDQNLVPYRLATPQKLYI